jgi:hypothetical protein
MAVRDAPRPGVQVLAVLEVDVLHLAAQFLEAGAPPERPDAAPGAVVVLEDLYLVSLVA